MITRKPLVNVIEQVYSVGELDYYTFTLVNFYIANRFMEFELQNNA